jgi:hypothetical protein
MRLDQWLDKELDIFLQGLTSYAGIRPGNGNFARKPKWVSDCLASKLAVGKRDRSRALSKNLF